MNHNLTIQQNFNHYSFEYWPLVQKQFQLLYTSYNIVINFHDLVGLSFSHKESQHICEPFLFHNNAFCNKIKSDPKLLTKCVAQKSKLIERMSNLRKPLYGSCYQGFEEIILPLTNNNQLIGLLCIGQLTFLDNSEKMNSFLDDAKILCTLLERIYLDYAKNLKINALNDTLTPKSQHILYSATSFIREHYMHPLSLELVAEHVHCNPTYLCTQFKRGLNTGFSEYINLVRVQESLSYLTSSTMSITEVAMICGFQDIAYFSRVFKKIKGISPREYRK